MRLRPVREDHAGGDAEQVFHVLVTWGEAVLEIGYKGEVQRMATRTEGPGN